MQRRFSTLGRFGLFLALALIVSCGDDDNGRVTAPTAPTPSVTISNDAALFRLITQTEPFSGYRLFPNVDEFTEGRLAIRQRFRSPLYNLAISRPSSSSKGLSGIRTT